MEFLLYVLLGIVVVAALMRQTYKLLTYSDRALKDIDKSKLRDLDNDGWDDEP